MILPNVKEEADFAADLVARLPATVRIGGFEFRIEKFSAANAAAAQRYGECSSVEQTIKIQEWMSSRYKAVDTVVHEISHAIFWTCGVLDEDKEERVVTLTSGGWVSFYRDNPWFLDWVKSAQL